MRSRYGTVALVILTASSCSDTVAPPPIDVAVGWVTWEGPGTLDPGDTIPVRVQSYGESGLSEWRVRLYLSPDFGITTADIPLAEAVASPVVPDGIVALTDFTDAVVPAGVAPGLYYLGAIADPDEELNDSLRTNNGNNGLLRVAIGVGPSAVTAAPVLVAPADRAEFDIFPRFYDLDWEDAPGAALYVVEVGYCYPWSIPWWDTCGMWFMWMAHQVAASNVTTSFVGAQPGRWRVRGLDAAGIAGPASAWRTFRSLR